MLENERVGNPEFYPMLHELSLRNLPDFQTMAAITFNDVIVSHEPLDARILFHELVHVEQYRQLGIERFAKLYVRGFCRGAVTKQFLSRKRLRPRRNIPQITSSSAFGGQ